MSSPQGFESLESSSQGSDAGMAHIQQLQQQQHPHLHTVGFPQAVYYDSQHTPQAPSGAPRERQRSPSQAYFAATAPPKQHSSVYFAGQAQSLSDNAVSPSFVVHPGEGSFSPNTYTVAGPSLVTHHTAGNLSVPPSSRMGGSAPSSPQPPSFMPGFVQAQAIPEGAAAHHPPMGYMWPDCSDEFDAPPDLFPLRKSVSEDNVSNLKNIKQKQKRPTTAQRLLNRSGNRSTESSPITKRRQSTSRRARRDSNPYSAVSAPVTPMNSRPSSPLGAGDEIIHNVVSEEFTGLEGFPRQPRPSHSRTTFTSDILATAAKLISGRKSNSMTSLDDLTTGLVFDSQMSSHACVCANPLAHPENPSRLLSVIDHLEKTGLVPLCQSCPSRPASLEELALIHSESYLRSFQEGPSGKDALQLKPLACGGLGLNSETVWNPAHSLQAALLAAGSAIELCLKVARGEYNNGMAIVRPPGHLAGESLSMGGCIFNNVAVAAANLIASGAAEKILILDWDLHHGSGTQEAFYKNSNVLYMSLHRYDNGKFFPFTGPAADVGEDQGEGFNVNIPWSSESGAVVTEADYLAAMHSVILPIAQSFNPDIILVSAGFGPAGTLEGGFNLSPELFGIMTRSLMGIGNGKVVLILEGGFETPALAASVESCLLSLLGKRQQLFHAHSSSPDGSVASSSLCSPPSGPSFVSSKPSFSGVEILEQVLSIQQHYWPSLVESAQFRGYSMSEYEEIKRKQEEDTLLATAALASLSVLSAHDMHERSPGGGAEDWEEEEDGARGRSGSVVDGAASLTALMNSQYHPR